MDIFWRTQLENDMILADDIVPEAMPAANSRGERARDRMLMVLSKTANANAMDFSELASDFCIGHCKPFIASTITPDEAECMKICHSKFVNSRRIIAKQIMNTVGFNAYLVRDAISREKDLIHDTSQHYHWEQYQASANNTSGAAERVRFEHALLDVLNDSAQHASNPDFEDNTLVNKALAASSEK